jgi:hypothetical protein
LYDRLRMCIVRDHRVKTTPSVVPPSSSVAVAPMIRDTRDMYEALFFILTLQYGMKPRWPGGEWPDAPRVGSTYNVYQLAAFPGIHIPKVTQIVMQMPSVSGRSLPCVEFCGSDVKDVVHRAESGNVDDMSERLSEVIALGVVEGGRAAPLLLRRHKTPAVIPIVDVRTVYNALVTFLSNVHGMHGPWPDAPPTGAAYATYPFAQFVGIKMKDKGLNITLIRMRVFALSDTGSGVHTGCIEFCDVNGDALCIAEASDRGNMHRKLDAVITRDDSALPSAMSSLDTLGVYNAFVSFLATELRLSGLWPTPPDDGSDYDTYAFAAFPGIRMLDNTHNITSIVLRVPAASGRTEPKGFIDFCDAVGVPWFTAKGSDEQAWWSQLRELITSAVAPPVDWAELVKRVTKVVDEFDVHGDDAVTSKKELLEMIRSFLDVLIQKSDARRSAGGK